MPIFWTTDHDKSMLATVCEGDVEMMALGARIRAYHDMGTMGALAARRWLEAQPA